MDLLRIPCLWTQIRTQHLFILHIPSTGGKQDIWQQHTLKISAPKHDKRYNIKSQVFYNSPNIFSVIFHNISDFQP
jgi:hypothetical protein